MPPDWDEVRRWVAKASNDRNVARKIASGGCAETDVAAFHCQQSIEKLLKAFLVYRNIEFERVHDLGRLLDQASELDPDFELLRDDVAPLTVYAVTFRYPGPTDPTPLQVTNALHIVDRVWEFARSRLPPDVLPQNE